MTEYARLRPHVVGLAAALFAATAPHAVKPQPLGSISVKHEKVVRG